MTSIIIHKVLFLIIIFSIVIHSQPTNISGNTEQSDVKLSWFDGRAKQIYSDTKGNYKLTVSDGWVGTVTPSKIGYTFDPVSRSYSNLKLDLKKENYKATLNQYLIQISAVPVSGGSISGGGIFYHGELVNLSAIPANGYSFVNWTENGIEVSSNSDYSFKVEKNRTLAANFLINKYTLTTYSTPIGSGFTQGNGIYNYGTLVNIVAIPQAGWKFDNWTENNRIISNDSNYSLIIFENKTFIAHFSKKKFAVITNSQPDNAGSTSGDGIYEYGSKVIISAFPNTGWDFDNWSENNEVKFITSVANFTIDQNRSFVANYSKKKYLISFSVSPPEGGIINGDSIYSHGDNVRLIAIANSDGGWKFTDWTENNIEVSKDAEYNFAAFSNRFLIANFQLKTYTVELLISPAGAGSVSGVGNYSHGDIVNISAAPNAGWKFSNWTENDINISNEISYNFKITENRNITANFAHEIYTVVGSPEPTAAGIVSGIGTFFFGQTATIIATPNIGWDFNNWTENGTVISQNPQYQFEVYGDRNLIANYSLTNYTINCSVNPGEAGFTSGCGISHYGLEMSLNAVANNGWQFINWTEQGDTVSKLANYVFTVDRSIDLTANFELVSDIEKIDNANFIPDSYYLTNAYPNPFNPTTNINFGLPEISQVKLFIVNLEGQIIRTLLANYNLTAGNCSIKFNADNLSSGIYFCVLISESNKSELNFKKIIKLILLK